MTRIANAPRSQWKSRHAALLIVCCTFASASGAKPGRVGAGDLQVAFDAATGLPVGIEAGQSRWLQAPAVLSVRRETSGATASPVDGADGRSSLPALGLTMSARWSQEKDWLVWDLDFAGDGRRSGYEVIFDLPVLKPSLRVFTPTDQGISDLSVQPTFKPAPYARFDEHYGRTCVLPLVSVFNPADDTALTIALPADAQIPHLQMEWSQARTLRLTFGHRGMGGGKPSPLRILFATHPADYRSALAAYIARYPAYFEPFMPRDPDREGAFWYHHIQDHPDFGEMERQNVRFIWSSFWFTYLGEYLPAEREWYPYTYAKWWKLGQTMSDAKINAFIHEMQQRRISTFAYFNVTEYGGNGGKGGDSAQAARDLQQRFANALVTREDNRPIPTWEGAMVMNARHQYALFPFLQEQVRRHIQRLPDFAGFIIDRLDWASRYDYAHDDGLSMIGDRPIDNLAGAVADGVREVCRLSHVAGKRVFVNQFYRVEVMRDVDGTCQENDYLAQRYLTPLRPSAAWEMGGGGHDYTGTRDLTSVEAHLKQRLQIALLPQMIAHQFPISQQPADEQTADLMELFAPLFKTFAGKRQVLWPHCITVSGTNDVNLFTDAQGRYVVPVTSRTHFLTRGDRATEKVRVTIKTPDAGELSWARVIPLAGRPTTVAVQIEKGKAVVTVPDHGAATMLVVGRGSAPADDDDSARLVELRDKRFPAAQTETEPPSPAPAGALRDTVLSLAGIMLYPGDFSVQLNDMPVGTLKSSGGAFVCSLQDATATPLVRIRAGDTGAWYLPRRICLRVRTSNGERKFATWKPGDPFAESSSSHELVLPLVWREQIGATADWKGMDSQRGGNWPNAYGATAAWVAGTPPATTEHQNGITLRMAQGAGFTWAANSEDPRALSVPGGDGRKRTAACWFDTREVAGEIEGAGNRPYRLTLYLLDYDRAHRAAEVSLVNHLGEPLDTRQVSVEQMQKGAYLTWSVTGPVSFHVHNKAGENVTLSGVFIDP
jgi:hypothetical protein